MRQRGFTLLEILVALTMFAVVGGLLLQLFYNGLASVRIADGHTHAVLLARSKLVELQAQQFHDPGKIGGEYPDGYSWSAVVEPWEAPASDAVDAADVVDHLRLFDLTLTVRWNTGGRDRQVTLKTLLLGPSDRI